MMNDCQDVEMRESLPELAHDALAERDAVRVREHLAGCGDCAAELAIIRAAIASSEASRIIPRIDTTRIAAAIPPYRHRSRLRIARMELAAAALIGAIGISIAVARHDGSAGSATSAPAATATSASTSGLALIGTADVSDGQLAQLINDLDHLDAVPPAEPESVTPLALESPGGGV